MDTRGKRIEVCQREKCYAPYDKKPMKVYNITGVCKYCVKHDEKLESDIKTFEILDSEKRFDSGEKPKLIKILDERTQFLKEEKEKRKQEAKEKRDSNKFEKKKTRKIKHYSDKGAKRKQEEDKVMRAFWAEHEDHRGWCKCSETGEWLGEYAAKFIHHLLGKGAFEKTRTIQENLLIVSLKVHQIIETDEKAYRKLKIYDYVENQKQYLKEKYFKNKVA